MRTQPFSLKARVDNRQKLQIPGMVLATEKDENKEPDKEEQVKNVYNPAIGDYTECLALDINRPECGLRYLLTVHNISFPDKCSAKKFEPKVVYDYIGNNLRFEKKPIERRIQDGIVTTYGEAHWTLQVIWELGKSKIERFDFSWCSGSLITFEWVLPYYLTNKSMPL